MATAKIEALSLKGVAAALGVSVWTVRREIDRGRLRPVRVGRLVRVRVSELERYLDRQTG